MTELTQVWVTLYGQRYHAEAACEGISDGHAKARSEGKRNHEPERWPAHMAADGSPRCQEPRTACGRCMGGHVLTSAPDDPRDVERAKAGPIARALSRAPRHLEGTQLEDWLASDSSDEGQTVTGDPNQDWTWEREQQQEALDEANWATEEMRPVDEREDDDLLTPERRAHRPTDW